jgi:hypothetical protein
VNTPTDHMPADVPDAACRRLLGLPLAKVPSTRRETDVRDAPDDHALWQHAEQACPAAATFAATLPPAGLALPTITLSA